MHVPKLFASRRRLLISILVWSVFGCVVAVPAVRALQRATRPSPLPTQSQAGAVSPATIISGNITVDQTWAPSGNPYMVSGEVTIVPDVTLTVEPGVVVQFAEHIGLRVQGTLRAIGTATSPIIWTGTTQQPGWWEGITFDGRVNAPLVNSALDYVTIEYGGDSGYGNLYAEYATVPVTHSSLRHSSMDGIYSYMGGLVNVSDTSLTDNARYPFQTLDGSLNLVFARLVITGNGINALGIGAGVLTSTQRWENVGVPYVITGEQTVAPNATLTVDPGTHSVRAKDRPAGGR